MNWLKLSLQQVQDCAALGATNPGPNFLTPIADRHGAFWISGDELGDLDTYAHYTAFLAQSFETFTTPPEMPVYVE